MSKAEDLAEKAYPYPAWSNETTRAIDDLRRNAFIEGYQQAEKDLALTWEDIASLNDVVTEMLMECGDDILYDTKEEFCKEALKRFKDFRERKEK